MAVESRLESLREKHATLEEQLHGEAKRPHPDTERLAALKREKLTVKDEIMRLSG